MGLYRWIGKASWAERKSNEEVINILKAKK